MATAIEILGLKNVTCFLTLRLTRLKNFWAKVFFQVSFPWESHPKPQITLAPLLRLTLKINHKKTKTMKFLAVSSILLVLCGLASSAALDKEGQRLPEAQSAIEGKEYGFFHPSLSKAKVDYNLVDHYINVQLV